MKRIGLALLLALGACTVPEDWARDTAAAHGMAIESIDGYAILGCSEDDDYRARVTLTREAERYAGTICCGFFKNCTLRIGKRLS